MNGQIEIDLLLHHDDGVGTVGLQFLQGTDDLLAFGVGVVVTEVAVERPDDIIGCHRLAVVKLRFAQPEGPSPAVRRGVPALGETAYGGPVGCKFRQGVEAAQGRHGHMIGSDRLDRIKSVDGCASVRADGRMPAMSGRRTGGSCPQRRCRGSGHARCHGGPHEPASIETPLDARCA